MWKGMAGKISGTLGKAKRAVKGEKALTPAEAVRSCNVKINKLTSKEEFLRQKHKRLRAEYEQLEARGRTGEADDTLDKVVATEDEIGMVSGQVSRYRGFVSRVEKVKSLKEQAEMNKDLVGIVKNFAVDGLSAEDIENNALEVQNVMDEITSLSDTMDMSMKAVNVDEAIVDGRKDAIRAEVRAKIKMERGPIGNEMKQDI